MIEGLDDRCPDCNILLTNGRAKRVEVSDGESEVEIDIFVEWCPYCLYVNRVQED